MGEALGGIMALLVIFFILFAVIAIPGAISRWIFRVNDAIALLESIDRKLEKLTEDKS